jgi:surfactin synthase thioesterase subunit
VQWSEGGGTRETLVCFFWAGAGAAPARELAALLPNFEVWAARLPGRESRIAETPMTDLRLLAEDVADAVEAAGLSDPVLFGHCFGSLLALETVRELVRRQQVRPRALIVVGQGAPSSLDGAAPPAATRDQLESIGYTDPAVLDDSEMMELLAPAIESDFQSIRTLRRERSLEVPILAFVGTDDETVAVAEMRAWAEETSAHFIFAEVQGDHLFNGHRQRALAEAIEEWVPSL